MAVNSYPAPAMAPNSCFTTPCCSCGVHLDQIWEGLGIPLVKIRMPCCGSIYHAMCVDAYLDNGDCRCDNCKVPFGRDFLVDLRVRILQKSFPRRATMHILQELPKLHKVCGICKEELTTKLKWNICCCWFHRECLARYTEVNNSCPKCR